MRNMLATKFRAPSRRITRHHSSLEQFLNAGYGYCRRLAASTSTATAAATTAADPTLVDHSNAPNDWDVESAVVYPHVITDSDAERLVALLEAKFHRRRYERGHWDAVIRKYRETELLDETENIYDLFLNPIRKFLEHHHRHRGDDDARSSSGGDDTRSYYTGRWLPCHAIDLYKDGELNSHVDSIRYSGNLVAGLSLLSSSIMRLEEPQQPDDDEGASKNNLDITPATNNFVDLLLPPNSLYVLSGISRYQYAHRLLPTDSVFGNNNTSSPAVVRDRRLSIIFRDAKKEE